MNSEQLSPWIIQEGHAEVQPKDGWVVAGLWSAKRSHYYNKIYTQKYVCLKGARMGDGWHEGWRHQWRNKGRAAWNKRTVAVGSWTARTG